MAELGQKSSFDFAGAWDWLSVPASIGANAADPIQVTLYRSFGAALLIAPPGGESTLAPGIEAALGLRLPPARMAHGNGAAEAIWAGPEKWLVFAEDIKIAPKLAAALGSQAFVSDQSGARALLAVSGPNARALLAKGLALDLHQSVFKTNDAALSSISHIGVSLWQTGDSPTYKIALARSMAQSFWAFLVQAGSEFGLSVSAK
jgi:methylglutamate dehydrogenase subunit D